MKRHLPFLSMLLIILFAGCSSDDPTSPPVDDSSPLADQAAQRELEARQSVKELQEFSLQPDGGIASLSRIGPVVVVPPGTDALADAIVTAGNGGVVILRPGLHQESGTVVVDRSVRILGVHGSILEVDTGPWAYTGPIEPALHVLGAANVTIWGVTLQPHGPIGGTGILLEDAPRATLAFNSVLEHQFPVVAARADRLTMLGNTLVCTTAWQDGTVGEAHGLSICNAERSTIIGNTVSNALFGMWPCDKYGVMLDNTLHDCFIGIILCRVPAEGFVLPSGEIVGAEFSATEWVVEHNHVSDCFDANYIVIDGANHNFLAYNASENPGTYDIELVGDSYRFGFLTPSCFENTVVVGQQYSDLVIKDCGVDNTIDGGVLVDTSVDPCF